MSTFLDTLRSGRVLLMDGAMGTELQRARLKPNENGALWNFLYPARVDAIHQAYRNTGAAVLLTNTFQAEPHSLIVHEVFTTAASLALCFEGAQLARQAAGRSGWILADIGPIVAPGPFSKTELRRSDG